MTTFAYDPLWNGQTEASTGAVSIKEEIAYYQCDHLGAPRELTDHQGDIAWAAQYKACGQAKEVIGEAARKAHSARPNAGTTGGRHVILARHASMSLE